MPSSRNGERPTNERELVSASVGTTPGTGVGVVSGSSAVPAFVALIAAMHTEGSTTRPMPLAERLSLSLKPPPGTYNGRTAKGRARRN